MMDGYAYRLTSQTDIVVVAKPLDSLDFTANVKLLCGLVQVDNCGVLIVTTKYHLGLLSSTHIISATLQSRGGKNGSLLVRPVNIINGNDS